MPINVTPNAALSDDLNDIRLRTARIVNERILPNESKLWRARGGNATDEERAEAKALRQEIQDEVKSAGLWAHPISRRVRRHGARLHGSRLHERDPGLRRRSGRPLRGGGAELGQPDDPGQVRHGGAEAEVAPPPGRGHHAVGLLHDRARERRVGSALHSDHRRPREGDEWVINGHKWFTSNGWAADFFIVMCRAKESKDDDRPGRMVQIIVPTSTPGVTIVRGIGIWGSGSSDHCEVRYDQVRVPSENLLGQVGDGHRAAQDRLGAGRIFHCMNSVGQMWRAFDLMVERLLTREVHGGLLKDKQFMQGFVADSYMDLQAARLMTIHAAEKVDKADPQARTEISAIKVFVPAAYSQVVDRAIQVWEAAGHELQPTCRWPRSYLGAAHAAAGRRPGRGAPHPHRKERPAPLREGRELGLRRVTAWGPGPAVSVFAAGLFEGSVAVVTGGGTGLSRKREWPAPFARPGRTRRDRRADGGPARRGGRLH